MARKISINFGESVQFPVRTHGFEVTDTPCPVCSAPLLCQRTESGFAVWCAREECESIVANQGAEGPSIESATQSLISKL